MAEDIRHLIDRIQKEGVDAARRKEAKITADAKARASAIVREAEDKARRLLEKAEKDAEAYTQRSIRTLEQCSRDLLIAIGGGVEHILAGLVRESLDEAMDIKVLQQMLVKIAEAYSARQGSESRIEYLIAPEDQEQLIRFFADRYRERLRKGVEVSVAGDIAKGFRVSLVDEHVHHDFTRESIAEALSDFLRPRLYEIVYRVARNSQDPAAGGR